MEEQWKQQFRDKLSGYRLEGVPVSWEEVGAAVERASRRKRAVWVWSLAGLAAAVAAALLYVGRLHPSPEPPAVPWAVREDTPPVEAVPPEVRPVRLADGAVPDAVPPVAVDLREAEPPEDAPALERSDPPVPQEPDVVLPSEREGWEPFPVLQVAPSVRKQRPALLAYGAVPGAASYSLSGAGPVLSEAAVYGNGERMVKGNSLRMDEGGRVESEEHHQQPVRMGLLLRYPLTDRIGVGTGLTYSVCRSTFSSTYGTSRTETRQVLHFVGVPFRVDCRLAGRGPFQVYASAGGLAEKMVKGTVPMKPLQFSVNGAVGVEYALSRPLYLFIEPGCSYYFDNGSPVRTLHTQRPLSFQLDVGLRFNIR